MIAPLLGRCSASRTGTRMPSTTATSGARSTTRALNLTTLAGALVARHVAVSVRDPDIRASLLSSQRERELVERNARCIAVVGAGASAPVLDRGDKLVENLVSESGISPDELEEKLDRLELVMGLDRTEFETQLVALADTEERKLRVKNIIATTYKVRHPTLLVYEQLAHLLKHRFIDAIISFNFDELLDQSLEDELSPDEYKRIVSERDCDVERDSAKPEYVPLYIKMHGTASEADSLRFTRDSYYKIPSALIDVVEGLFDVDHCVIANVGFGMASFDFQNLLRFPGRLDVYDLSKKPIADTVKEKVTSARRTEKRNRVTFHLPAAASRRDCSSYLTELLHKLAKKSKRFGGGLVHFRSVKRHEAIAQLLGPDSEYGARMKPGSDPIDRNHEVEYLKRRVIVELAFAAVKARGLLSIDPLATDRGGMYYERYNARAAENQMDWHRLCRMAGLKETASFPDILVADDDVLDGDVDPVAKTDAHKFLRGISVEKLADKVLNHVSNPRQPGDADALKGALRELMRGTEIELHSRSDRVCSKAFFHPVTLPTRTALEAYTRVMLEDLHPEEPILLISETGEWLTDKKIAKLLKGKQLKLVVAFSSQQGPLNTAYPSPEVRCLNTPDPWRHNRHMTIVTDRQGNKRAIYFYRRLRTPYVTPVFLHDHRDVGRLTKGFNVIWAELEEGKAAQEAKAAKERYEAREAQAPRPRVAKNADDPRVATV